MITPQKVTLRASETVTFSATAPRKCTIDPGVGTIDETTGTYTAPGEICERQEITVCAGNKPANGHATITLLPPPLQVVPAAVDLASQQQQRFRVVPVEPVKWETPAVGKISPEGVYTPPWWIFSPRVVVLTAHSDGNPQRFSCATINLLDTPLKRSIVGIYLSLLSLILIYLAVYLWGRLCPSVKPPSVLVSPPIATLHPSDKQAMTASIPGSADDGKANFAWSKS